MNYRTLLSLIIFLFTFLFSSFAFDCSTAIELRCGVAEWRNLSGGTSHLMKDNYNTSDCGGDLTYLYQGNDIVFYFDVVNSGTYTLKLTGLTDDLDMFVFGSCSNVATPTFNNCFGKSAKSGTLSEQLSLSLTAGKYYVVIDDYNSSNTGSFDLELICSSTSPPTSIDCSSAIPLQLNVPVTSGAPLSSSMDDNNYDVMDCVPGIFSYTGGDELYSFDAGTSPINITLSLSNLSADLDLLVFKSCGLSGGQLRLSQCVGLGFNSSRNNEEIKINNATGIYYIAVDGFNEYVYSGYKILVSTGTIPPPPPPSYGCSDAIPLACGTSKWVNAPTVNNFSGSDYNFSNCWSNSAAYDGKDHLYKIEVGSTPSNMTIKLSGLSKDMDMFLFRSCEDHYGNQVLTNCVAKSMGSSNSNEEITVSGAIGTYYLSVDGYNAWMNSGYEISLECSPIAPPPPPSYGCSDAIPLACGTSKWVNAPTVNNFSGADYNFSNCWSNSAAYDGNDHLYKIVIGSSPRNMTIKMSGLSKDMDMFLFRSCEDHYGNQVLTNCVAKSIGSSNSNEEITVSGATGTYYLSIDGYNAWMKSGYEISLECTPIAPPPPPPSYGCSDAIPLACGTSKWVNAPTVNHFDRSAGYDLSNCWSNNNMAEYDGNDHLYKIVIGSSPRNMTIKMSGLSKDMDMFLFRNCEDHYGNQVLTNCVAKSIGSSNSNEEITVSGATGTYYLSIDGYNAWMKSGYEISLECTPVAPPPPPSYGCSDAIPLACGTSKWVNAPTVDHFSGAGYNFSNCWSNNSASFKGKDHLYKISLGNTVQNIKISLSGLTKDMDMLLFRSCEDHYGNEVLTNCIAKSIGPNNSNEEIIVSNASGTYYLSVDGYNEWMNSGYKIALVCDSPQPEPSCSDIEDITCGYRLVASTASSDSKSSDRLNSHNFCQYGSGYSGREVILRLDGKSAGLHNVTIDLKNLTSNTNLDLFVYNTCVMSGGSYGNNWAYQFSNPVQCSQNSGSNPESIFISYIPPNTEVFIVVDTKISSGWADDPSQFELVVSCGDICDQSIATVECGSTVSSTTVGRQNDASYYKCEPAGNQGNNWGPEKTYKLIIQETSEITIDLDVAANADLNLYLLQSCSINSCKAYSKKLGKGKDESISATLSPGTYYIVIDGYQGSSGAFDLSVSGCGCTYAQDILCNSPINSTTVGAANKLKSVKDGCFNSPTAYILNGGDKAFKFKAPESKDYTFKLTNFTKNLDLFLLDDCKDSNACRGFSTKIDLVEESITTHLDKDEEIYVIVDSRNYAFASSFRLEVVCKDPIPDPPACFDLSKLNDQIIQVDLKALTDGTCGTNSVVTVYPITNPATGEINDTAGVELVIQGDSLAIFEANTASVEQDYLICYSTLCVNEPFVCCKSVSIKPVLSCGDSYTSTTIGGTSTFAAADIEDCYSSSYNFFGPDELIKFVKSDSTDILEITLYHSSSNLSLFIFDDQLQPAHLACKGTNYNATKTLNNTSTIGESYTDADSPLPAGIYYALVEGYGASISSDFTLSIACGLDCNEATPVICEVLEGESTDSAPNRRSIYQLSEDQSVVAYYGGENIYELNVAFSDSVTIYLDSVMATGDLDLFLRDACDNSSVLAYSILDTQKDRISIRLDVGTYYIIVDGWNGAHGTFDLVVDGCFDPDVIAMPIAESREAPTQTFGGLNSLAIETYPNPFEQQISFVIESDNDKEVQLRLFTPDGKILYQSQSIVNKGKNFRRIDSSDIGNYTGMIIYTIQSRTETLQGRIIRLR